MYNNQEQEDIWSEDTYEEIIREIQDYLQLYLFKDSSINNELAVTQLFNLDKEDINTLKNLHFLISKELEDFIKILPYLMRNLSHSTNKEEIETHGNIIGQINWNQTVKQRLKTGLKDKSLFVCNTNKKLYNLPENQLLKYILTKINKSLKDMHITYNKNYEEDIHDYQEYLNNIHIIINKTIKNVHLKNVELPQHITTKTLRKTIKSHNNLYEYLINVYQLYEKLFITYNDEILLELLNKRILKPNNKDTLYEVYILFKIIERINHDSLKMGLLKSGNDYIIHSKFEDKEVNIYYQHLPEKFLENNLEKLRPYYDIQLSNKRPDIIIEYIKNNKKTYKIIEIKRTQNQEYIRDSIYKVFGYLKDYEKVPLQEPNILVVWDGIELVNKNNLDKQELIILNKDEFIKKINNLVLYEEERIDNDYWQQLQEYHEKENPKIGNFYDDDWYAIDLVDIPYKIANIQLKINKKSIEIQLYHIFFRDVYDYLYEHIEKIEKEMGDILIWKGINSKKKSSSITLSKEIDFTDRSNWQECIEWHSQMINKFQEVFTKYLKEYDLEKQRRDVEIDTYPVHRKYWDLLNDNLKNDNLKILKVSQGGTQIVNSDSNISDFRLRTDYNKKYISVEVFLYPDELFEYLKKDKENIEEEIGYELIWNSDSKSSSKIILNYDKYNPKHEELWHYCRKWQLEMLEKFYEVFYHRIEEFEIDNIN